MNPIVQQPKAEAPASTPAVSTQQVSEPKQESLIHRLTQAPTLAKEGEAPKVTVSLDDIKDPVARQIIEKKLEEVNKGASETFGKIGAEKSKYLQENETLRKQIEASSNKRYTTADVQNLLNRQDFVQAAMELQNSIAPQGVQQESWSSWTDTEKQAFQRQQSETNQLKSQLEFMQQSQVLTQVDSELKQEYPDYDSISINDFYQKAQSNQISPKEMREAVYWATKGKELVNRAYQLGQQDNKSTIQERLSGMSPSGQNIVPTSSVAVEVKPGQRTSVSFANHAHKVLDMLRAMPRK